MTNVVRLVCASTMNAKERLARMAAAPKVPPLTRRPRSDAWLSIVGYGPSLRETWQAITHPMITCSGAHNFLLERGIVPNWHAESDPWPAKAMFTRKPHKDVTYLIASCCDPQIWGNVQGNQRRIWHCAEPATEAWLRDNAPAESITGFGTTVGERAVELGMILGYRRFKFFGIDCSFTHEQRAGEHHGGTHEEISVDVPTYGTFKTSHAMLFSARTLVNLLLRDQIECEVYGNNLVSALLARAMVRRQTKDRGLGSVLPTGNVRFA